MVHKTPLCVNKQNKTNVKKKDNKKDINNYTITAKKQECMQKLNTSRTTGKTHRSLGNI